MSKNSDHTYLTVGKMGSPYGVKGWIKVNPYTDHLTDILRYNPWYLSSAPNPNWQPIHVEQGQAHGKGLIVKLSGYDNPEDVRLLAGKLIAITRDQLPPLPQGEYYWHQLQGLTVINQNGENLGTVTSLLATGANDVLVVKGQKEHAIPYLFGTVILKIDLAKQEILVNWEML